MTRARRDDRQLSAGYRAGSGPFRCPSVRPLAAVHPTGKRACQGRAAICWRRPRPARIPVTRQDGDTGSPGVVLGGRLVAGEDLVEAGEDIGVETDVQRALRGV